MTSSHTLEDEVALAVKGKLPVSRAKVVLDQGIHWQEDDRVWNNNFQELFKITLSFLRGMSEGTLLLPPELQEDSELVHWIKVQLLLCERDFFPSNNLEKLAALRAIVKDSLNLYLDEMDGHDKATDLMELLALVDPENKSDDEPSPPLSGKAIKSEPDEDEAKAFDAAQAFDAAPEISDVCLTPRQSEDSPKRARIHGGMQKLENEDNPSDSPTAMSCSEMEAILTEDKKRPDILRPKRHVARLPQGHVPFLPTIMEDPEDKASPTKYSMDSPDATRYHATNYKDSASFQTPRPFVDPPKVVPRAPVPFEAHSPFGGRPKVAPAPAPLEAPRLFQAPKVVPAPVHFLESPKIVAHALKVTPTTFHPRAQQATLLAQSIERAMSVHLRGRTNVLLEGLMQQNPPVQRRLDFATRNTGEGPGVTAGSAFIHQQVNRTGLHPLLSQGLLGQIQLEQEARRVLEQIGVARRGGIALEQAKKLVKLGLSWEEQDGSWEHQYAAIWDCVKNNIDLVTTKQANWLNVQYLLQEHKMLSKSRDDRISFMVEYKKLETTKQLLLMPVPELPQHSVARKQKSDNEHPFSFTRSRNSAFSPVKLPELPLLNSVSPDDKEMARLARDAAAAAAFAAFAGTGGAQTMTPASKRPISWISPEPGSRKRPSLGKSIGGGARFFI